MARNSKIEELDGEFRLMVQKINSFLEHSLKTNHEKKRLKLWLDKLLLENEKDESTKMNRNDYARYVVDFICKKGTIPAIFYKEPPEGNLQPLGLLLKGENISDRNTTKERREGKLKDFTKEARCLGKAAYDEAYEAMRRHKQLLDNQMRGKLQQLATEERAAADYELQCYNTETIRMREQFRDHEKEIMDLVPHFKWSEYREKPDLYFKEILQQCPPRPFEKDDECHRKWLEDQIIKAEVENQFLEVRLDEIRQEVAVESNKLEQILDESDCHLESIDDLKMSVYGLSKITSSGRPSAHFK